MHSSKVWSSNEEKQRKKNEGNCNARCIWWNSGLSSQLDIGMLRGLQVPLRFATIAIALTSPHAICSGENDSPKFDIYLKKLVKSNDRLSELQSMVPSKIFSTRTHEALATSLLVKTTDLQNGSFINRNGVPCRLIQGPRGVGKSTVLSSFAEHCSKRFTSVIPIYLNCDDLQDVDSCLRTKTILKIVEERVKASGVSLESNATDSYVNKKALVHALENSGKFVLLIIDEIDQAYRVTDLPEKETVLSSLNELAWLGGQRTGRFAVYLCGSSSSCPLLITCQANAEEFPRQRGAPHLNETKYQTFRLPITTFDDLSAIENLLRDTIKLNLALDIDDKIVKGLTRLVSFGVGAIPRSIDNVLQKIREEPENPIFANLKSTQNLSGFYLANSSAVPLYDALVNEMRIKNKEFIQSICEEGSSTKVDLKKVMTVDWQGKFRSLNAHDIERVWRRLCEEGTHYSEEHKQNQKLLQSLLIDLFDRNVIVSVNVENGLPSDLYPLNVWQLFHATFDGDELAFFMQTWDLTVKNYFAFR